jgi:hypothetical protein
MSAHRGVFLTSTFLLFVVFELCASQPGAPCTHDNDCPVAAPRCSGPAIDFKVCCQDIMGGWNHPCQSCTSGIPTFICPGTSTTGCAEPMFPTPLQCTTAIACNNRVKGWNGAACERFTADTGGKCKPQGLCSGATDYALCTSAVTTAFQCASSNCRDTTKCQRGDAAPASLGAVCFINAEAGTCPTNSVCSPTGDCKKILGQTCSSGSECLSTFCQHGVCCNVASCAGTGGVGGECRRCDRSGSVGTCTADVGVVCGGANAIACSGLVSGFSTRFCQKFAADTTGLCDNTGTCIKTDTNRCITNGVSSTNHVTCGDVKCIDSAQCQPRTPLAGSTLSNVCKLDTDVSLCADIQCSNFVRGWAGNACQLYGASPRIGRCDSTGACFSGSSPSTLTTFCLSPSTVQTCPSAACIDTSACVANSAPSTVATLNQTCHINADIAGCTDIDCRTTVKGWNGARCERYNMIHDGYCLASATCDTDVARCATAANVAVATAATCPSTQCRDLTKCGVNSDATQADSPSKVCLLNVPSAACSTYTCTNQLAGLSGAQCLQYDRNGAGFCTSGGVCETTCDLAFQQTTSVLRQCASVGCVRPNVCTKGSLKTTINSIADLCFVNDEQGTCAIGGRCDASGLCKTEDSGGPCTIDDNCVSKFCWRPVGVAMATNNGKCCSSRCDLDCNECSTGSCTIRTGQTCDQPPARSPAALVDCNNRIRGWNANQCQRYQSVTSKQCTSSALCSSDPALCAANSTTGAVNYLTACTSSQCKKACNAGDAIGGVGQASICFSNEDQALCPDIECSARVSGWSGATCQKYKNDHLGFCENEGAVVGRCSTKETLCPAANSAADVVVHRTCLSQACVIASACQAGSLVSAQMDVCESAKVINACPSIGCTSVSKGWNGLACERYTTDHPGYCQATTQCAVATDYTRCSLDSSMLNGGAGLAGIAEFSCGSLECRRTNLCQRDTLRPASRTTVCFTDEAQSGCPDISCTQFTSGWVGNTCNRYNASHSGWCLSDTSCDTSSTRCSIAGVGTVAAQSCPSQACRNPVACQQNAPLSSSDTLAEACLLNVDMVGCNPPTTVPCNKFLTGWNGRTCERYNRASSGRCDATGACITTCAAIPSQSTVPHVSCGHVGCIRPNSCVSGSNGDSSPSVDSLCFTDGARHSCPMGAVCDATGDCVYNSDALACANDIDCYSGFCVKPPGVCCNRRCSNECEECLLGSGKCQAKTGTTCSFDVKCTTAIKGVNPAVQSQCQRFQNDRKGVCLQTGVCGNAFDLCTGSAGVMLQTCGSTSCRRACDPLKNVTTADTLPEACYVDVDRPECDDIPCTTLLAGWNTVDRSRCDKYAIDHPGYCDATGTCSTDGTRCAAPLVSRSLHQKCGAGCQKIGGCIAGDSVSQKGLLTDICIVNQATSTCPQLNCTSFLKGWSGRTCQKYAVDLPGRCDATATCELDPATCSATTGVAHIRCGDAQCAKNCEPGLSTLLLTRTSDVCNVNVAVSDCGDIQCTQVVRGWNGATCERFAADNTGYCDSNSECSKDFAVCATTGVAGIAVSNSSRCGSTQCRRVGGCVPLSPVASANSLLAVCDVSVENKACPAVSCSQRLAGWAGATCLRYTVDSFGYCDETASCLRDDQCGKLFSSATAPLVSCGSIGCIRATTCVENNPLTTADSVGKVCFTDNSQHGCPSGATCDDTGSCVFAATQTKKKDNSLCTSASECASNVCIVSSEGMRICCNSACPSPCSECVRGVCKPKVGFACGVTSCQACDELGQCVAKSTLCAPVAGSNSTTRVGTTGFGCTSPNACNRGVCGPCTQAPMQPPVGMPILPPPPVMADCKDSIDCGSNAMPPKGTCVAGKCMCSNGFSGALCEQFGCKLPINCNEAAGGGKCTGANTCTCNAGFSGADCLADCSAVNNCSGHGFCAAENVCQCDPGFGKAIGKTENDCSATLMVGMGCTTNATCPTGVCWKASPTAESGFCCASPCAGECNSCSTGICSGLLNTPCAGGDAMPQCKVCRPSAIEPTRSVCEVASTLCEDAGGLVGTAFGCEATHSCFEGNCVSCTSENMTNAVECGAQSFKIDLTLVNPTISMLVVCGHNLTFSTNAGCGLQWKPTNGIGVDCATAPDGLLTANAGEVIKIALVLAPAMSKMSKMKLTFGSFVVGQNEGKVTVLLEAAVGGRRRQEMMVEIAFNDSFVLIEQQAVIGLNVEATKGSFDLRSIESVSGIVSSMSTTVPSSGTSDMTTVDESTSTAPPMEKGFIDRLNDGFAGMDDVYLGGFLVVLIVLLLMISACAVVGFLIMRNRRRREPAAGANDEDDGTELKGANAATVPKLSAPYQSLPAMPADYDLLNGARIPVPGYDRVEDPTVERVDGYHQIQLPTAGGYNVLPGSASPTSGMSSASSLHLPPPTMLGDNYLSMSKDDIDRRLAMSFTREI